MENFENYNEQEKLDQIIDEQENVPETKLISREDVYKWIMDNNLFETPSVMKIGTLLGGDRLSCTDEAVAIMDKQSEKIVGVATIAPEGEECSGQPTIVGEFVLPEFRGKGLGKELFIKTLERCKERGFENVRVDIMSGKIAKIVGGLMKNDKWKNYIKIGSEDTTLDLFQG